MVSPSVRRVSRSAVSSAFTLVELLVVIAVVATLIAMLMPALNQAREQARRVACAANQRSIGTAAHVFAGDRREFFPRAFAHTAGNPWPSFVELQYGTHNSAIDPPGVGVSPTSDAYWKAFGTDLVTWQAYGIQSLALPPLPAVYYASAPVPNSRNCAFRCPSVVNDIVISHSPSTDFGDFLATSYMYLAGYPAGAALSGGNPTTYAEKDTIGLSNYSGINCPNRKPAVRTTDQGLNNRIMSLDRVWSSDPLANMSVNHGGTRSSTGFTPTFVNVLWGDCHVGKADTSFYPAELNSTNWSMLHYTGGPYFYWGGR